MKNKKAISPLIATVLIIGFTIVLAAVVIQWGGQLVEKLKGQTDIKIESTDLCQKFTDLSITKITPTGTGADVEVDNKNDQAMSGFIIRAYLSDNSVVPTTLATTPITAFGVQTGSALYTLGARTLKEVGVVPQVILTDGSKVACPNQEAKKTYIP